MNYTLHYNKLIQRAKNRILEEKAYYETHHIVPRSEGGLDEGSNLVKLTAREHYLAHYLLWMEQPQKEPRARAFWFMSQDIKRRKHTVSSKVYEKIRIAVREANMTGAVLECLTCGSRFYKQKHAIRKKNYCCRECFSNGEKAIIEKKGWTEESRAAAGKRRSNEKTINNGKVTKYVDKNLLESYLKAGWIQGPLKREAMRWYSNGVKETYIPISKTPPTGWKPGRVSTGSTKGKKAVSKDGEVRFVTNPLEWISKGWQLGNTKYYPGYKHNKKNKH